MAKKYGSTFLCVANVLPPAFIMVMIATIWCIHFVDHLLPMIRDTQHTDGDCISLDVRVALFLKPGRCNIVWQLVISQTLTALLVICFARSVLTHPGAVPNSAEWKLGQRSDDLPCQEVKLNGERRHCKWCLTYKPDRCHHCRICGSCVLRMDHHCPWIMNCVGFRNHKFFFLLVVYAVANTIFIGVTLWWSLVRSIYEETAQTVRFRLVFCFVIVCIMGVLSVVFLSFHTWLLLSGMTTIEFCEKGFSGGRRIIKRQPSHKPNVYETIKDALGPKPILWLLPLSPPDGDGIHFMDADVDSNPEWTVNPANRSVLSGGGPVN